jgi:branched-chain amino acid transport system ATP-binding protein
LDGLTGGYGKRRLLVIAIALACETKALLLDEPVAGAAQQLSGSIYLGGMALHMLKAYDRAAVVIGWVPQERNIFKSLTVHENLTAVARPGSWTPSRVYELFPRLAERQSNMGTQLSGGEQQMLAVGRALVLSPKLLLLDGS